MDIALVIPPNTNKKWVNHEDKHAGYGRIIIPYTLAQIHALIQQELPDDNIHILESQLKGFDQSTAIQELSNIAPDIAIVFMSWTHLDKERAIAETNIPTIAVILQQFIDQREAVEKYQLRSNWFTKQEIEVPIVEALKEYKSTGRIQHTPGFLVRDSEGGYDDTGEAPLADLTTFPMPSFDAIDLEAYFALRESRKLPIPKKIHLNTMKGVSLPLCILWPSQSRQPTPHAKS